MDAATLLEHRDFVTAVARALLRDPADVEDAVQETYVAALQSDPPRTGRVRPWLGGIARNIARNLQRSGARRARREQAAARPDRAAAQSTEKLRWQQRVVEEVLALDPMYRDVLLLRFYEEMPPRRIAEKLDLPVNTVRTRTRRALELLRKRFDERYGRMSWSAALAGLFAVESAFAGKVLAAVLIALVAGTAWVGHNAMRGDPARSPRRTSETRATNSTVAGSARTAAEETGETEAPRTYRGRLVNFDIKQHPPLANATVYLTPARRFEPIATTTSDADGRFSFRWDPEWASPGVFRGYSSHHIYVVHEGFWTDAMFTDARAVTEELLMPVQLLAHPRFVFVRGDHPVVGAKVSLHAIPSETRPYLAPAFASGATGADGSYEAAWPTWRELVLMRLKLPDGDLLQWQLNQTEVRSFDPYDVPLDPEEIAAISVRVVDRRGKPAPDASVLVRGVWAPDGDTEESDWTALSRGAQDRPLIGVTDADGRITFRFPADRAPHGMYVPHLMIAFDAKPRFAFRQFEYREFRRDQTTPNGRSLPTLKFGPGDARYPWFVVEGHRNAEYSVHWRGTDGGTRIFEVAQRAVIPGYTICQFGMGGPGPLRGRGQLSVVADTPDGCAWSSMDEATLALCTDGARVVKLGPLTATRTFALRASSPCSYSLEAVEFPFVVEGWLAADDEDTIQIPDVEGLWRIRIGDSIQTIDPVPGRVIRIRTPPAD
ncbi:MAG: RNA polymerase sigma factor [Planctomycetota bacterium]|jgi:RNA polymerase sigma-70 factor (ECF subfamily)